MKTFLVALIAILAVASVSSINLENSEIMSHFLKFIKDHSKKYESVAELTLRYKIFTHNMLNNEVNLEAAKLSPFMDLSTEEFSYKMGLNTIRNSEIRATSSTYKLKTFGAAPDSYDFRSVEAVTPVKDQGACGSCWAFSAIGNVESLNILKTKKEVILSEQQLVDCDTERDQGCNGGLMDDAFTYLTKNGAESADAYPYTARDGKCKYNKKDVAVEVKGFSDIEQNEDRIKEVLFENGPLSVAVNANPFQFYTGKILRPTKKSCNPQSLNHGVLLVGYGSENGVNYWIIKNSWGQSWGEEGYIRLERGTGACGINTMVSTAVLK